MCRTPERFQYVQKKEKARHQVSQVTHLQWVEGTHKYAMGKGGETHFDYNFGSNVCKWNSSTKAPCITYIT